MGMDPASIALIGTLGSAAIGGLSNSKKKPTEYTSTKSPGAQGLENSINQYYQSLMGKSTPYVPMNSQMFQGANILSNAYAGGPYTHYGNQQKGGAPGQPVVGGGGPGAPGVSPGRPATGGGMPPWLAQMAAAKGTGVSPR
jgi:hypothetical protein